MRAPLLNLVLGDVRLEFERSEAHRRWDVITKCGVCRVRLGCVDVADAAREDCGDEVCDAMLASHIRALGRDHKCEAAS